MILTLDTTTKTSTHTTAALVDLSRIILAHFAPRLLLAAPPPPAWLTNAAVGLVVSATGVLRSTFESGPLGHCGCWVATARVCTAVLLVLGWVCARVREGRLLAALPWWGETALCFALPHATGAMPMGWDPATGAFVALGIYGKYTYCFR